MQMLRRMNRWCRSSGASRTVLLCAGGCVLALFAPREVEAAPGVLPLGSDFQVNAHTTGWQSRPAVKTDAAGGFVVAWTAADPDGAGVRARRFGSDGNGLGVEFQVNGYTTSGQSYPAVGVDRDGGFAVVWSSSRDGSGDGVFGRSFASNGQRLGVEFQVNTYTTFSQYLGGWPGASAGSRIDFDGTFVVVWTSLGSSGTDTSQRSVQAQRFSDAGARLGGEIQVNTTTSGDQRLPAVAMAPAGQFVVAWGSEVGVDPSDVDEVHAQRFDADGARLGGEFQVNSYTTGSQFLPAVALDDDGGAIVVWSTWILGGRGFDSKSVQGQRLAPNGTFLGAQFQVNSATTGEQTMAAVATGPDGDFVAAWIDDGNHLALVGQRFTSVGSRLGSDFAMNSYTTSGGWQPSLDMDPEGELVAVWSAARPSGDQSEIVGRRFVPVWPVFDDGFESGDTSAWGQPES